MSAISNFLSFLRSAIYAIDVRDGIADAIEQCYNDVNNPTLKTEALEAALQNKIDEGEMAALTIGDHTITAAKLAQGVIDNTLATSGAAADAKKTGDELTAIKADLADAGMSSTAKAALLACFRNVAWTSAQGQEYYDALAIALDNEVYPQIRASFNPGTNKFYIDDSVNMLKQYLTIKYYETAQSAGTVIASSNYTLSGALTLGASLITVTYNNLNTVFKVDDVADFYNIYDWDFNEADALYLQVEAGGAVRHDRGAGTEPYRYVPAHAESNGTNRSWVGVRKGKSGTQIVDDKTGEIWTPLRYLIPIPADAIGATFTITPSNQYCAMNLWMYEGDGNWLRNIETGWKQGSGTLEFTARENQYVSLNCKPSSGSDAYNDSTFPRPTVNVHFSKSSE